jgi:hypothetical protein
MDKQNTPKHHNKQGENSVSQDKNLESSEAFEKNPDTTPENGAQKSEMKQFWADAGLPQPSFSDLHEQEKAPVVNREALRKLAAGTLGDAEIDEVYRNILRYETWAKAYSAITGELLEQGFQNEQSCLSLRETAPGFKESSMQEISKAKQEMTVQEEAQLEARRKETWAGFGLPPPDFSDWHQQENAPVVDREHLIKFDARQLNEADARDVVRNIIRYETWAKALVEITTERLRRRPDSGS